MGGKNHHQTLLFEKGLDVDAEKEIPSCELIATKCIGSGVTSEVYQGHWTRIGKARTRFSCGQWLVSEKRFGKVFLICCWLVVVMATVECLHIPSCFIEESNSKEGLTFIPGCNWWGVQPSKLRCYCGCVYLVIWTSFFHAYHRKKHEVSL